MFFVFCIQCEEKGSINAGDAIYEVLSLHCNSEREEETVSPLSFADQISLQEDDAEEGESKMNLYTFVP